MKRKRTPCAICGRSAPSKKRGVISLHPIAVSSLRAIGARLKKPKSDYLHSRCALKAQHNYFTS